MYIQELKSALEHILSIDSKAYITLVFYLEAPDTPPVLGVRSWISSSVVHSIAVNGVEPMRQDMMSIEASGMLSTLKHLFDNEDNLVAVNPFNTHLVICNKYEVGSSEYWWYGCEVYLHGTAGRVRPDPLWSFRGLMKVNAEDVL